MSSVIDLRLQKCIIYADIMLHLNEPAGLTVRGRVAGISTYLPLVYCLYLGAK